jgi:hypothetical protein
VAPKPTLVAPAPVDPETIAKARAALEQKMKQLETQPPAPVSAPAPASPEPASRKPKVVKTAQPFPPIAGPPPAVSANKQERLTELLRKYRADEITPEEYHQQRAKILGEP